MSTLTDGQRTALGKSVRDKLLAAHYSLRTEKIYLSWIKRFLIFHDWRNPAELTTDDINRFLTALAVERKVSASTQTQALSGVVFLYRNVLGRDMAFIEGFTRAKVSRRVPVVFTPDEVRRVLTQLSDTPRLAAGLMYGSGLRLMRVSQNVASAAGSRRKTPKKRSVHGVLEHFSAFFNAEPASAVVLRHPL